MELKNVDAFLNAFAKQIVDNAKKNLVDDRKSLGSLYQSVSYTYDKSEQEIIIGFLMEDYAKFIDKGVRGKTQPIRKQVQHYQNFSMDLVTFLKVD